MSRERTLASIQSDITYRRGRWKTMPLEEVIDDLQRSTSFTGEPHEPCYRNDHVCRRHLLIDNYATFLKKRYNRVARRVARRQLDQVA